MWCHDENSDDRSFRQESPLFNQRVESSILFFLFLFRNRVSQTRESPWALYVFFFTDRRNVYRAIDAIFQQFRLEKERVRFRNYGLIER